jgi:hypothetical protein
LDNQLALHEFLCMQQLYSSPSTKISSQAMKTEKPQTLKTKSAPPRFRLRRSSGGQPLHDPFCDGR